ncbi:MAG: MBL fold metallo-hydrolase [Planctomycetota bacterium]|nr:MBL fold metallo-hydrolase [Planctomycetota bacterium]
MTGLTRKNSRKASGTPPVAAGDSEADKLREKIQNNWYLPVEELDEDEIRISFMGTNYAGRPGQSMSSVFIETGNGDSFVFDCGCGVISRYTAMGVPSSRMTKVFLTHLHGDHTSDLVTLYCFGPAHDRKTPLHVYGPSGPILDKIEFTDQGTKAFCESLYRMCAWHRESMSFKQRMAVVPDYSWDITGKSYPPHELADSKYDGPYAQFSDFTMRHILPGSKP